MKHDADWKILATLGFLVATVAVPTVASLVAPENGDATSAVKMESKSEVTDSTDRKPAAVNEDVSHVINFDLSCAKGKNFSFKAEGTYVQLKGHDCSKNTAKTPIVITNKTNGFTASIFQLSKNEYQTDLIQLKEGENQISIQFESAAGTPEEQVLQIQATDI
jgi:hypothetical protein